MYRDLANRVEGVCGSRSVGTTGTSEQERTQCRVGLLGAGTRKGGGWLEADTGYAGRVRSGCMRTWNRTVAEIHAKQTQWAQTGGLSNHAPISLQPWHLRTGARLRVQPPNPTVRESWSELWALTIDPVSLMGRTGETVAPCTWRMGCGLRLRYALSMYNSMYNPSTLEPLS